MNSSVITIKKDDWERPVIDGVKYIPQVHIPQERHGIDRIHTVFLMAHNGLVKHNWSNAQWQINRNDNTVVVILEIGQILMPDEGEVHIMGEVAPPAPTPPAPEDTAEFCEECEEWTVIDSVCHECGKEYDDR